jgi:hypothetical protein
MRQFINIIVASLLFHASAAWSTEVQISCNIQSSISTREHQTVYILNLEELSVSDVGTMPIHKGELQILDNFYQMDFPQTTIRASHMATINRYSGEYKGEMGRPPFGTYTEGNWFRNGLCNKMENKKVF